MIMDGLRYLSNPENRIAKAQLAAAYQNEILKNNIDLNTLLLNDIDEYLPVSFIEQQKKLRLMPLYELMEKLFGLFEMSRIKQQDAYLCAFFDAVVEYLQIILRRCLPLSLLGGDTLSENNTFRRSRGYSDYLYS